MLPRMPRNLVMIKVPKVKAKEKIALPTDYVEANIQNVGVVEVVGKDCEELKPGDLAYFRLGLGNKLEDDELDPDYHHLIIAEHDCIAYYSKEDEVKKLLN